MLAVERVVGIIVESVVGIVVVNGMLLVDWPEASTIGRVVTAADASIQNRIKCIIDSRLEYFNILDHNSYNPEKRFLKKVTTSCINPPRPLLFDALCLTVVVGCMLDV